MTERRAAVTLLALFVGFVLLGATIAIGGRWAVHWWNYDVLQPYHSPDDGHGGPRSTDASRVLDLRDLHD